VFRKVLFWCHLAAGLFAGIVVFIMSITGVILTYEKQMLAWDEKRAAGIAPAAPDTPRASIASIVERVQRAYPGSAVATITRRDDPQAPIVVALNGGVAVLAHPRTGELIGQAPKTMRQVFRTTTEWHRYLAGTGDNRAVGKAVTGACNLAFLFLVLSGVYLWMPRRWTSAAINAVTRPRWRHPTGKARDFNWHNALGFWSAVPLAIVVASATVISYPWASDLAYRVVGDEPPPRPAPPPSAGAAAGRVTAEHRNGATASADRRSTPVALPDLDQTWQLAEARVPAWKTVTLRMPANAKTPLTLTVDAGYAGQPQHRSTLTVDPQSGDSKWDSFEEQSTGRRFRSMLRFAHTGEYWGLPGQTIAGVVSAAACVLVWTGFALAWRRFFAWRARRLSQSDALKKAA
jgi:uncharacterized iron-regulated membrane protein